MHFYEFFSLTIQKIIKLNSFSHIKKRSIEDSVSNSDAMNEDKKRRFRRAANEIERHYNCPIETCKKSYG